MRLLRASVLIILLMGCTGAVAAIQVIELQWEDLVGTFEFEDPFEELTSEQVYDLGTYVRVRKLKESDPSRVTQNMEDESREAESRLEAGGVDVYLWVQRTPARRRDGLSAGDRRRCIRFAHARHV